jgi:hypothetical protein
MGEPITRGIERVTDFTLASGQFARGYVIFQLRTQNAA